MASPSTRPGTALHASAATQKGLTLLELLVVITIAALASAAVALSMRGGDEQALQREAQRLVGLLESGRAWSRSSGQVLRWTSVNDGFVFQGYVPAQAEQRWLSSGIEVHSIEPAGQRALVLGPEPIIAPQAVVLRLGQQMLRLSTDGLAPFEARRP